MQTLNSTMSQILQKLVQTPSVKPISETKAFQQLKMFNGDRKDFKDWNEKLIAALCQTHTKMKPIVQKLVLHMRVNAEPPEEDQLKRIMKDVNNPNKEEDREPGEENSLWESKLQKTFENWDHHDHEVHDDVATALLIKGADMFKFDRDLWNALE